jgi:hypothetical protein
VAREVFQIAARVGKRFSALKPFGIDRLAARESAGRQAQMSKDSDNHRRIFDGGDDLKLPPQFGQWSMSISKTRLSSLAQLMRAGALCACA